MSAYIFLGPELGKKQDAVDNVKKIFPGAEETVFYAGETPASTIADTLQNHCLFADCRLVIVKNAETIKEKSAVELFASCIKDIDKNTGLILLSDENKIAAGLENAVQKSNKQIFYELFEREKNEWVRNFFRRAGFQIESDGIDAILELVENNTEALNRECTRLIQFLPKGETVKAEDIEEWLSHNREESAFTLFSRIAKGDLSGALEIMASLLNSKESAMGILAGLAWCFRKLNDYLMLLESGGANDFELRKIGLASPKARDDYSAAARRYNTKSVQAALALTAEYDILLRSPVAAFERVLMDRYLTAVMQGKLHGDSLLY